MIVILSLDNSLTTFINVAYSSF